MSVPVMFVPVEGDSPSGAAARRLLRQLRRAGATNASAPAPLEVRNRLEERALKQLLEKGVVRPAQARGGRYWIDEERAREVRHAQLKLVAMILIVELGVMAALALNLPRHGH